MPLSLVITKGLGQAMISREAVDFLLDILNLDGFIKALETNVSYGMDEHFLSTLNSDDRLRIPGGFTRKCLTKNQTVQGVSR